MDAAEAQREITAWERELHAELTKRGLSVQSLKYGGKEDAVAAIFVLIDSDPVWRKAVTLPADAAMPDTFERELTKWKADTLTHMVIGTPPLMVRQAMRAHGYERVREAMR